MAASNKRYRATFKGMAVSDAESGLKLAVTTGEYVVVVSCYGTRWSALLVGCGVIVSSKTPEHCKAKAEAQFKARVTEWQEE